MLAQIARVDAVAAQHEFALAAVGNQMHGIQIMAVLQHSMHVVQGLFPQGDHQRAAGKAVAARAHRAGRPGLAAAADAINQSLVIAHRAVHKDHLADALTLQPGQGLCRVRLGAALIIMVGAAGGCCLRGCRGCFLVLGIRRSRAGIMRGGRRVRSGVSVCRRGGRSPGSASRLLLTAHRRRGGSVVTAALPLDCRRLLGAGVGRFGRRLACRTVFRTCRLRGRATVLGHQSLCRCGIGHHFRSCTVVEHTGFQGHQQTRAFARKGGTTRGPFLGAHGHFLLHICVSCRNGAAFSSGPAQWKNKVNFYPHYHHSHPGLQ